MNKNMVQNILFMTHPNQSIINAICPKIITSLKPNLVDVSLMFKATIVYCTCHEGVGGRVISYYSNYAH